MSSKHGLQMRARTDRSKKQLHEFVCVQKTTNIPSSKKWAGGKTMGDPVLILLGPQETAQIYQTLDFQDYPSLIATRR